MGSGVDYEYDSQGMVASACFYAGGSQCLMTRFERDTNSRVVKSRVGSLPPTLYEYGSAGNLSRVINVMGEATEIEQGMNSRLVSYDEGAGGHAAKFSHNLFGSVDGLTDPNGGKTAYTYNGMGAAVRKSAPGESGTLDTEYELDGLDMVTGVSMPGGNEISVDYEGEVCHEPRFLSGVTCEKGGSSRSVLIAYNSGEQLSDVNDGVAGVSYAYDGKRRLIGSKWSGAGHPIGKDIEYDRDDDTGQVTAMRLKSGNSTVAEWTYQYSATLKRLSQVSLKTRGSNQAKVDLAYGTQKGLLERVEVSRAGTSDALVANYDYDENWRLSDISYDWDDGGGASPRFALGLSRRDDGLIEEVEASEGGLPSWIGTYGYSRSRRLTTSARTAGGLTLASHVYDHDPNGNIISLDGDVRIVHPETGRLKWNSGDGCTYDANGALVECSSDTRTLALEWDACGGRLERVLVDRVEGEETVAEYTYDYANLRIGKRVCTGEGIAACPVGTGAGTKYVWSGDRLIAELDSDGNVRRVYTWLGVALRVYVRSSA